MRVLRAAVNDVRLFDWPPAEHEKTRRCAYQTTRSATLAKAGAPSAQQMVAEFHERFDLPRSTQPTVDIDPVLVGLRNSLLHEEAGELMAACIAGDLVAIADGIADVLYVVYGTAVTYGLDADALLREVHRSNMSKLGSDGLPVRRWDGKILKGPNYSPPELETFLAMMGSSKAEMPPQVQSTNGTR